jgi:hypothetical protein
VWDGLCGEGRIREPALSEVEGSMPSESSAAASATTTPRFR